MIIEFTNSLTYYKYLNTKRLTRIINIKIIIHLRNFHKNDSFTPIQIKEQ